MFRTAMPAAAQGFPLTAFPILNEFESITCQVDQPIKALGCIKPKRDMKDSILRTLCSSLLGTVATTRIWKDKSRYAAIDEAGVHLLIFKGEDLYSSTHYAWSGMEDVVTSVDQEFVHIAFSHRDEQIAWQILRYQIVEPDGTYMMDTEDMKQVGEMTSSMEARFRAVAGA
jgi:hypothetical protein